MKLIPVYDPTEMGIEAAMPYLDRALAHTKDWTLPDVKAAILGHKALLMKVEDAGRLIGAGVVTVDEHPARNVLMVHLFGAQTDSGWPQVLADLRAFGRGLHCSAVRGFGRRGWARELGAKPIYGWEIEDE